RLGRGPRGAVREGPPARRGEGGGALPRRLRASAHRRGEREGARAPRRPDRREEPRGQPAEGLGGSHLDAPQHEGVPLRAMRRALAASALAFLAFASLAPPAPAQPAAPVLLEVSPPGGQPGTTVKLKLAGKRL